MKLKYIYILLTTAIFIGACESDPIVDKGDLPVLPPNQEESFVNGELLVQFKAESTEILDQQTALLRSGGSTRSGVESVDKILDSYDGYQIERVFPVDSRYEGRVRESGMHLWYVIRFNKKHSESEIAEKLSALGSVENVSYNRIIKKAYKGPVTPLSVASLQKMTQSTTRSFGENSSGFNDPLLPKQWALINNGDMFTSPSKAVKDADVQCKEAWIKTTGDPSIIVAVVDEGVMYNHPDLAENMWVNEGEEQLGAMKTKMETVTKVIDMDTISSMSLELLDTIIMEM